MEGLTLGKPKESERRVQGELKRPLARCAAKPADLGLHGQADRRPGTDRPGGPGIIDQRHNTTGGGW